MKVVVIGASGQLGQDLLKVFADDAIALSHQDIDVTDGIGVSRTIRSHQPDWVINTAAFHRVDDCEQNATHAFAVNATGAANVARVAAETGAGVVFYSTDYVFGGVDHSRNTPHGESDMTTPLNVYGVTKQAGEQLVALSNPRHLVIRTAGLYGTSTSRKGWTFPELMVNKAKSDGKLRVVTDQALSPTYTHDLAATTKQLMERDAHGLFHLTNDGECSWYELAAATLALTGIEVDIEPMASTPQPGKAVRPPYSAMYSERLAGAGVPPMRSWQDALAHYLEAKGLIPDANTTR